MSYRQVHLWLRHPWAPALSDKCLLWLASLLAAEGLPVEAAVGTVNPGPGELLLTNQPRSRLPRRATGEILRLSSPTDRLNRLMLLAGNLYGRTPLFHGHERRGLPAAVEELIACLRRPFRAGLPAAGPEPPLPSEPPLIPAGRKILVRINLDWDEQGFRLLERWCDQYGLRPTLAAATVELRGRERRFAALVRDHDLDLASHSHSHHVVLPAHGRARQRSEIADSRARLEDLAGRPVMGFVAPYLKYDRRTFALLTEQNFHWLIRSYLAAPLPIAGYPLTDLGMNFSFAPGWREELLPRLALGDLSLQLHLPDLPALEPHADLLFHQLPEQGARLVDCATLLTETRGNEAPR